MNKHFKGKKKNFKSKMITPVLPPNIDKNNDNDKNKKKKRNHCHRLNEIAVK